jgi:hypothetical protein
MNNEDDDWSYVDLYAVIEGRVPSRTLSPYRSQSSLDEQQQRNNKRQSREGGHVGRNPHSLSIVTIHDSQRRKDPEMSINTIKNVKESVEEITENPSKKNPIMTKQKKTNGRTISKSLTPTRTRARREINENHVIQEGSKIVVPNTTSPTPPVRTRSASLWNEKHRTEGTNTKNSTVPRKVVLHSMHQEQRRYETERERNGTITQDKKSSSVPTGISIKHNVNNSHPPSRCTSSPKRSDRSNEKMSFSVNDDDDITKSLLMSSSRQESKELTVPLRRRSNSCHTPIGNKTNIYNTSKDGKKSLTAQKSKMSAVCAERSSSEHNHHVLRRQPKNDLHNSKSHTMMDNNNNNLVTNQRLTRSLSPIPVIEIPSSLLDRRRRIPTSQSSPTRNTKST